MRFIHVSRRAGTSSEGNAICGVYPLVRVTFHCPDDTCRNVLLLFRRNNHGGRLRGLRRAADFSVFANCLDATIEIYNANHEGVTVRGDGAITRLRGQKQRQKPVRTSIIRNPPDSENVYRPSRREFHRATAAGRKEKK